jgi:hypothetical protein
MARTRGPYWAGAPTPAGTAAIVVVPHRQRRCCRRCSVTRSCTGGKSKTCRTSTDVTGARRNEPAQPWQARGRCVNTSSGESTCRNVKPGSPGCFPGARSEDSRRERGGAFPGPSDDGGFEDVREFLRSNASNSATRRANTPIRASRSASAASNRASRSSSSRVAGDSDTTARMPQTTSKIKAVDLRNLLNSYQRVIQSMLIDGVVARLIDL